MALEPANLLAGPFFFTPTLELETYYTDNLWLTETDEKSTWVGVLTPKLQSWLQEGVNTYSLTLELKDSTYENSSDDDYTDYRADLDLHHEFNAKNVVNVYGEYFNGHEERGTGFIEGSLSFFTNKPVEYTRTTAGGDYTYGGVDSRGRLKLAARTVDYSYDNFRGYTRYYDRSEDTLAGTFYWKIAPRTDALLEARAIDNDYDQRDPTDPAGTFTSKEMNYLLGLAWEMTARTSGHVKLGMYDRDYDSAERTDEDGFLWEVGVTWEPRSYSSFALNTRRFYQETTGLGNGVNTEEYTLGWRHDWNQRVNSGLKLLYTLEDYEGATREDDNYGAEARFGYAMRRWLDLGVGYRYEDRDSSLKNYSYTENVLFLEARVSL